ncbi:MAG TPA: sugar ABC transporter permease [Thermotogota bacterium]|nr:sugar ABC transporter permease [Thermotogota bacterium]
MQINKKSIKETLQAYLFLLPSFVILGIFVFWPIGYSFVLSFFKWDFANQKNPYFNGFANYAKLFEMDMPLPYSVWTAVIYSVAYIVAALCIIKVISGIMLSRKHFGDRRLDVFRKRQVHYSLIAAALFVATWVSASLELQWLLALVAVGGIAFLIRLKKRIPDIESTGMWTSLILGIIIYVGLKLLSGVRFELFDYLQIAKESSVFIKAIYNTLYYVILTTPTGILLSLGVAMLLNLPLRGKTFYRTAFFIPYITSAVAISLVWQWIFNDTYGLLNYFISVFGGGKVPWLTNEVWTIPTIAIIAVWKNVGYNAIIFLAGLQSIDRFYYEAAEVDGASRLQQFRHITWPLLSPTTFFVLIVSIIGNFKVFTQIFVLYHELPGPYNNSGMTMVYYIFNKFYKDQRMGEASAAAYVLFMIILVLTFFQFRAGKKRVSYTS